MGSGGSPDVLIIDDDEIWAELLSSDIETAGLSCAVVTVMDMLTQRSLSEDCPAVVAMDLDIGDGLGANARINKVREFYPDSELVVVTGFHDWRLAARLASSTTADDFQVKSTDRASVVSSILYALSRARRRALRSTT